MHQRTLITTMLFAAFVQASGGAEAEQRREAPFGSWRSPISADLLVQGAVRFGDVSVDGEAVYWVEGRPHESGRYAIVRRESDGTIADVLPAPFSARTTLNEYGGGALLAANGTVYFTNYADQQIWRITPGRQPQQITHKNKLRFGDYRIDQLRNRLIAVCEDHTGGDDEPDNRIVAVDLDSGTISTLVEGADFYSTPRLNHDGSKLAWLSWNHPNMPWDGTELYVAEFDSGGKLINARMVAGGDEESIFQPSWSPDGTLCFVSDRSNWWNLYSERDGQVKPVVEMKAEFGVPQWVFGMATYGFLPNGEMISRRSQGGTWSLLKIDPRRAKYEQLQLPYSTLSSVHVTGDNVIVSAGSPTEPESLVQVNVQTGRSEILRRSSSYEPSEAYTSEPEPIEFPTDGNKTAHAFYYPPTNAEFRGPAGQSPPLIVLIHGGPTSATSSQFRLSTQYWTSRGFAVCDVNYGGSTGYGREYRNRLRDAWGVVDVRDAINAALHLVKQGKADREKLIIRGGSAGGYTTLAALTFSDVFRCGASLYGISDLALMVHDTHKFESRYLDRLVGELPRDEATYRDRSPIFHLADFDRPVILLQGLEDKIVPPNQAELILDSLKQRRVPVAYVPFAGEQHGFRIAANIIRAQEAELYFYSQILGFPLAEAIEPVEIFNLPTGGTR